MADRALGNPLGNPLGLARAADKPKGIETINPVTLYFYGERTNAVDGVFLIPEEYGFFRVTAIGGGAGSSGATSLGGGGGGVSRSAVLKRMSGDAIEYSIAAGGGSGVNGGTATASFRDIRLRATGGVSVTGAGGVGTGGVNNTRGGAATSQGGGGCGGILTDGGPGGVTGQTPQLYTGDGGGGGAANTTNNAGAGGGGFGMPGGVVALGGVMAPYGSPDGPTPGGTITVAGATASGGRLGGGAGARGGGGGVAGIIIELW